MGWSDFVPQGHPTRAPGTPAPSFGQRPGASFGPGDPLTREQLAAVLWRAAGEPAADADLSAFPDGAEVSPWAADPVEWAVSTGLLRGYNHTGELAPGDPITRAQLAMVLYRQALAAVEQPALHRFQFVHLSFLFS